MGDIYRADDTALGRDVAVKVLADRYARRRRVRARFTREALAAARLSGEPHIVTIFDVGEHDGRPFIVMEYLAAARSTIGCAVGRRRRRHGARLARRPRRRSTPPTRRASSTATSSRRTCSSTPRSACTSPTSGSRALPDSTRSRFRAPFSAPPATSRPSRREASSHARERPLRARRRRLRAPLRQRPVRGGDADGRGLRARQRAESRAISRRAASCRPAVDAVFAARAREGADERPASAASSSTSSVTRSDDGTPRRRVVAAPPPPRPRRRYARPSGVRARGGSALGARARGSPRGLLAGGDDLGCALDARRDTLETTVRSRARSRDRGQTVTADVATSASRRPTTATERRRPPPAGGRAPSSLNDAGFRRCRRGDYAGALPLLEQAVARSPGTGSLTEAYASYNLASPASRSAVATVSLGCSTARSSPGIPRGDRPAPKGGREGLRLGARSRAGRRTAARSTRGTRPT